MTKNFFALLFALVFVFTFSTVFAQLPEELTLSPIDETAAADVLGEWFYTSTLMDGEKIDMSGVGFVQIVELNADNTAILSSEMETETEEAPAPEVIYWDMNEDGTLNFYRNSYGVETAFDKSTVVLSDEGELVETSEDESSVNIFARELPLLRGDADVKANATFADFEGKWTLYAMIAEGVRMKANLIGMENAYVEFTEEGSMHLFMDEETDETIPVEADEDGVLFAVDETTEGVMTVFLLEDNTVEIDMVETAEDQEVNMVLLFVPEGEVVDEPLNLVELMIQAFSDLGTESETEVSTEGEVVNEAEEVISEESLPDAAEEADALFEELGSLLDSAETN